MSQQQVEHLIRILTILLAAYEPTSSIDLASVDGASYAAGFRAGARSAYADSVCRLRELQSAERVA